MRKESRKKGDKRKVRPAANALFTLHYKTRFMPSKGK